MAQILEDFSRSKIQKAVKNGDIKINGKTQKASYLLAENDIVEISLSDDEEILIKPQNLPLDIRYEDENMLVVNKPKNMLTHPTSKETENTLVNALLYKYGYDGLSDVNGNLRPGILHRLDRNTSGLLMVAKNNDAHNYLAEQIKTKTAVRKYLAVVSGNFNEDTGTIDEPIARHPSKCEKFSVSEDGKPSVTHYKVLERFNRYTLLELQLETGRTHQIRVHLSYIGHPIVNDSLYGGEKIKVKTTEQVLQAYKLSFIPFKKSERVDIELTMDNDITRVLNKLRNEK
ncbi:MAG: RluA family pseudouridine synthase [Candidatus Gastranaerophilales bacterium]|nr:RluA family pseudouridine synthase [Candidatus Gastranaerophilales bacterium]